PGVPDRELGDRVGDTGVPPGPGQVVAARRQAAVAVDDAAVGDQVAVGLLEAGVRGADRAAGVPGDVDRVVVEDGRARAAQEVHVPGDVVVVVELTGRRRGRAARRRGGRRAAGREALLRR